MPETNCIFCLIAQGKAPCHEIWSSPSHLAFLSIFPNTPGFTVVIPREHHPSYAFANDDRVLSELVLATKKVASILDAYYPDVKRCGMFLEGYGVDHLHSKLFPMHGAETQTEGQRIETARPTVFFERYPGYLSSHDAQRADDAELGELAAKIRASNLANKS